MTGGISVMDREKLVPLVGKRSVRVLVNSGGGQTRWIEDYQVLDVGEAYLYGMAGTEPPSTLDLRDVREVQYTESRRLLP